MAKINVCMDTLVKNSKGKFITVTFKTKKGYTKKLNGRIGVHGDPYRYDSETTGGKYLLIWEVKTRTPKRVNLRTIERIAMEGTVLTVAK